MAVIRCECFKSRTCEEHVTHLYCLQSLLWLGRVMSWDVSLTCLTAVVLSHIDSATMQATALVSSRRIAFEAQAGHLCAKRSGLLCYIQAVEQEAFLASVPLCCDVTQPLLHCAGVPC